MFTFYKHFVYGLKTICLQEVNAGHAVVDLLPVLAQQADLEVDLFITYKPCSTGPLASRMASCRLASSISLYGSSTRYWESFDHQFLVSTGNRIIKR
jgi:hypothetical protein